MNFPCKKCEFRYSSYCIGCKYELYGINGDNPTTEDCIKMHKIKKERNSHAKKIQR